MPTIVYGVIVGSLRISLKAFSSALFCRLRFCALYVCISVFLKFYRFFCFIPPVSCSGSGGIFGAVCGPRLRKDASVVFEFTPDVCFDFAKRGSEIISGVLYVPRPLAGYECKPFGCGRRAY